MHWAHWVVKDEADFENALFRRETNVLSAVWGVQTSEWGVINRGSWTVSSDDPRLLIDWL